MAPPTKKRQEKQEESDDEDSTSLNVPEQMFLFEGHPIHEHDGPGIEALYRQLFPEGVNLRELRDIVVSQNYIGSVIKMNVDDEMESSDDDDDSGTDKIIFGSITVVNLSDKKDVSCISQIKQLLLKQCTDGNTKRIMEGALLKEEITTGLIISERMVNIPPQIAPPLYQNLQEEIVEAVNKKMPFKFDNLLLISRISKFASGEDVAFFKPEESYFQQVSVQYYDYKLDLESGEEGMEPYHRVLLFPGKMLDSVVEKMCEMLTTY